MTTVFNVYLGLMVLGMVLSMIGAPQLRLPFPLTRAERLGSALAAWNLALVCFGVLMLVITRGVL